MKTGIKNNGRVKRILSLFEELDGKERRELITRLNGYSKFWEDVEDTLTIRQRAKEPRIPYHKIRERLKREGRL